jgi:hypothetical protein
MYQVCLSGLDDGQAQHNRGVTVRTNIRRNIASPQYLNVTFEELHEEIFCILQRGSFLPFRVINFMIESYLTLMKLDPGH